MGVLTAEQIRKEMREGRIEISPYDEKQLAANSYDVRLHPGMLRITNQTLDLKKPYDVEAIEIPEEGYTLIPGELYLGVTVERTKTPHHIPKYDGRSTMGRYFLTSHETAGFGDLGFDGQWTLEITVKRALKVYPRMRIGQVSFFAAEGEIKDRYTGTYSKQSGPMTGKPGNL